MEWLKKILEKAALTEDGKLNVEAVMAEVQKEFSKHAVPKTEFDDKVGELKAANDTITELKKTNGDNEELQKKVGDYEKEIGRLNAESVKTAKTYALKEQLAKAGVLDPDYLIYKAGGVEKFTFDKENRPVGVEEAVKPYKADKAMAHLFQTVQQVQYQPAGGSDVVTNPFAKDTFNLTAQGKLLRENPVQARQMAAAAGVTI